MCDDVTIENWLYVSIMFSHVYHVSLGCAELAKTVCTRLSFPPPPLIIEREPGDEATPLVFYTRFPRPGKVRVGLIYYYALWVLYKVA